jgi:hypothetical protein
MPMSSAETAVLLTRSDHLVEQPTSNACPSRVAAVTAQVIVAVAS